MLPLFSYGTLRDPEFQMALFDRTFETREATLHGYVVVSGGDYHSAMKHPGGFIRGALVSLDEAAYAIADRWEDLEVYSRKAAVALETHDGKREPCFFYLRPSVSGELVTDDRLTNLARDAVLADIRAFRAKLGL